MRHLFLCALALLLTISLPVWATGDPDPFPYHVTTIDLPVPTQGLAVRSLTDQGDVLGTYLDRQGQTQSFLRHRGRLSLRPILILEALNTAGDLVGTLPLPFGGLRGILFADGEVTVVAVPLPSGVRAPTEVTDLNEARHVVGDYLDDAGVFHGFVYDAPTGTYTTIDAPFPTDILAVTGINTAGHLTGVFFTGAPIFQGFLQNGDVFTPLQVPGAVGGTEALDINDQDVVVGIAVLDATGGASVRGFVYQDGTYTVLQVPGAVYTELTTITNQGVLGGRYVTPDGVSHGVILTPHGQRPAPPTAAAVGWRAWAGPTTLDLGRCPVGSLRWACRAQR